MSASDIPVSNADDSVPSSLEECGAGIIEAPLTARIVHVTLQLHHEAFRHAVEIHDEAVQDMLAAELEAEYGAIAQKRPGVPLSGRRVEAELTCESKPLCG